MRERERVAAVALALDQFRMALAFGCIGVQRRIDLVPGLEHRLLEGHGGFLLLELAQGHRAPAPAVVEDRQADGRADVPLPAAPFAKALAAGRFITEARTERDARVEVRHRNADACGGGMQLRLRRRDVGAPSRHVGRQAKGEFGQRRGLQCFEHVARAAAGRRREFCVQRAGRRAGQQRDLVHGLRFLLQQHRNACTQLGQLRALACRVQVGDQAAVRARLHQLERLGRRRNVGAREPQFALRTAQFEVVARHLGLHAELRLPQQGRRCTGIRIGGLDAAPNAAPQIDFPRRIEAGLVEVVGLAQCADQLIAVGHRRTQRVDHPRGGTGLALALSGDAATGIELRCLLRRRRGALDAALRKAKGGGLQVVIGFQRACLQAIEQRIVEGLPVAGCSGRGRRCPLGAEQRLRAAVPCGPIGGRLRFPGAVVGTRSATGKKKRERGTGEVCGGGVRCRHAVLPVSGQAMAKQPGRQRQRDEGDDR